jgi:hypothetical protein
MRDAIMAHGNGVSHSYRSTIELAPFILQPSVVL